MKWYSGTVIGYNAATKMHEISYEGEDEHCHFDEHCHLMSFSAA